MESGIDAPNHSTQLLTLLHFLLFMAPSWKCFAVYFRSQASWVLLLLLGLDSSVAEIREVKYESCTHLFDIEELVLGFFSFAACGVSCWLGFAFPRPRIWVCGCCLRRRATCEAGV